MAAVGAVNLIIHKGTYFEETFTLTTEDNLGFNLNSYSASAKVKKHPTAGIAYTFSTTLTVADNTVKIYMPANITINLPSGRCYYDIVLTSSAGVKTKVVEGNVLVEETASS
jgi:hypothetical protein